MREMGLKGVVLNLQAYSIVIDGLVSKGEVVEACEFLEEVFDKDFCLPSLISDEAICGLCHKGLVCRELELLKKNG